MQLVLRTAFALLALTVLSNGAYATDPASSPDAEAQAIQGDEGKSGAANKSGSGPSAASDPAAEAKAIEGDEGKSGAANKPGPGSSSASDPAAESKEIEGN